MDATYQSFSEPLRNARCRFNRQRLAWAKHGQAGVRYRVAAQRLRKEALRPYAQAMVRFLQTNWLALAWKGTWRFR